MFIPDKSALQNQIPRPDCYVVYGWQRSYFTHKLMAALNFYAAEWRYADKTAENEHELRLRSGTHQIPVLHTPENWMIADTTPLLQLLDSRFPQRRMFPEGPMGVLVHVLEEFFDEWIARTTVHWRWAYEENHELLALDAAHGDRARADALITWGAKVRRATGVDSPVQQAAAESEYHRLLAAAERQLAVTPFLLGERPSAVDCIFIAGLRAHFLYDPAPDRAIRPHYPRVVDWVEQHADQWTGTGEPLLLSQLSEFARTVLAEMGATWAPFVLGNRQALLAGDKAFVLDMYGESVSYLARPYVEQSRRMLAEHIGCLGEDTDSRLVKSLLEDAGLLEAYST